LDIVETRVVRHQGYDLHCSARTTGSGMFVPVLMVAKAIWPSRPRTIAIAPGTFASEEAATEAALAQGIVWVMNFG
jgi:hypothetical protein